MATLDPPARAVLEGVPYVGHDMYDKVGKVEGVPFCGCLRECLSFLGEEHPYELLMGASGAAFRLLWKPGWHGDNVDIMSMAADAHEPLCRAFEAVGRECEVFGKEAGRANEAYFRERIIASITQAKRPVIAFGVIGPPECCIVAGYDEGGEVLIGWNYFQSIPEFGGGGETDPSGYFRKRNWFPETPGLIIIGEARPRPSQGEIYRRALEWALQVMHTPKVRGRHNGIAAFDAWMAHLGRDEDFPAGDMPVLRERHMVHSDAVGTVAEGRWYGSEFLRQVAATEPAMASDLHAAADCFVAEHDLMWAVWEFAGGNGWTEAHVRRLAEPGPRRRVVPLLRLAREKDERAADLIERALAR